MERGRQLLYPVSWEG